MEPRNAVVHDKSWKIYNINANLLKEFPNPKTLLNNSISRSLGVSDLSHLIQYSYSEHEGLKKATVTLLWPCKIEEEGYAPKRGDAERIAAAAACLKLKEMGVIGPNNQLPRRRAGRGRGGLHSAFHDKEDNSWTDNAHMSKAHETQQYPSPEEDASNVAEALSLFPQPKSLLGRVIQELELLDKNNNPLTHARYHREKVKEAGERDRRPLPLEIPNYLKSISSGSRSAETVGGGRGKRTTNSKPREEEEEEEDLVTDAITGRPYKPLSKQEVQELNVHLQEEWEEANPGLSVELPVDDHRQRVVSAVQSSRVVVIAGETGCGKTTRIPRFLLEECVRGGEGAECNILVTQPRRISAVSVAHRVAHEMGPSLKHSVGYQVRLESRPPEHSGGALLFLTVGVLLRKLQSNPSLKGISHIVVDEVHERDINTDLLLALLRSSLKENPDLRVVLMSATGDNKRLAQYFGGCPIVKVPGFMHPVKERYLEDVLQEMGRPLLVQESEETDKQGGKDETASDLDLVADVIEHIDINGEPGAVLCFLPGWQDIKAVQEKLEGRPHFSSGSQMILPLHSSLSVADQQTVFQRPPKGQRKIVLTTNIAETSITIDDIVHVVDAGTHKEQNYDPRTKAEDFLTQVLDSPDQEAVRDAVRNLQEIGVLDGTETLTPLGERVACMSCDPRLGKVLVLSAMFRCVLPMLSVAACLTRDPFHNSLQNRALVNKALGSSSYSDYLVFSRAVLGWRALQQEGNREDRDDYLDTHTLSRPSLRFINGLISQFSENLHDAELVSRASECQRHTSLYNEHSNQDELIKAVLLAGFYPNLIQVKKGVVTKGGRFRPNSVLFRTLSGPVLLHRSSVNRGEEDFPSRWLTFFYAVKSSGCVFIRDSSVVHPLALLLLTDCDIKETVRGDRVEVSFPGRSLVHCELTAESWELLWELRTSIQTMLYRNLNSPNHVITNTSQDGKLISLLVNLLNNTDPNPFAQSNNSDSEVD
ncbi:hypothetical protein INR49_010676 [Caranx melampygus]|nr:hypothetical protein INR49_010676 [Caranx melampygus]